VGVYYFWEKFAVTWDAVIIEKSTLKIELFFNIPFAFEAAVLLAAGVRRIT